MFTDLEGLLGELGLLPEVGSKVTVEPAEGIESGLGEVSKSSGSSRRGGEAVGNTSVLEDPLGGGGSDNAGTAGSRHKANVHRAALAVDLVGHSVGQTDLLTPIATTDGHNLELSSEDSTADGVGNLLADLDTETNVAIEVTNEHEGLETGTLTGTSLLLHRLHLHNLILELVGARGSEEVVNDLVLLLMRQTVTDK